MTTNGFVAFPRQRHVERQIVLLALTVMGAWAFLAIRVTEALWQTLALYVGVAIAGVGLITLLSRQLRDRHVQKLGYVFLFKLLALLLILYAGWVPMLDPLSTSFGYDPQRYYFDARTLIDGGFNPAVARAINVNYPGIIYYYGVIFALIGQNPVIPALVNAFITLLATLLVVRVGYQVKRERGPRDWWLGLGMIVPEVLWFDALTARETLTMALTVISTLSVVGYVIRAPSHRLPVGQAAVLIPALLLLGVVRTPLLVPVMAIGVLSAAIARVSKQQRVAALGLVALVGLVFLLAPALSVRLGGYDLGYRGSLTDDPSQVQWGERSVGRLLTPTSAFQAVTLAVPRILLYLVVPLPRIDFSLSALLRGHWFAWQGLMMSLSSLLYVLLLPLALASLIEAVRHREWRSALAFHIPCWTVLLAVAGGSHVIQERYRLPAMLFLWGAVWLGLGCSGTLLRRVYRYWGALVALGGVLYAGYKVVP